MEIELITNIYVGIMIVGGLAMCGLQLWMVWETRRYTRYLEDQYASPCLNEGVEK